MNKAHYKKVQIYQKSTRKINARPQEGQSLVEYSLLLGLIAVAVIGAISVLGLQLNETFTSVTNSLGGTSVPYTPPATFQAGATPTPASSGNSSGSGSSGENGGNNGNTGGSPATTVAATTVAPTATPVPTTAAPTATPAPTTTPIPTSTPVPTNTPVPTTVAPTATLKPTTAPTATPAPTTVPPTATTVPTTATLTDTPSPSATTAAATGQYTVAYTKTNQWYAWNNGTPIATSYEVNVVITNKSSTTVNNWTISWKLENKETFNSFWNAGCTISGSTITCTNPSDYNNVMKPNGSVSFYVQLNSSNMNYTVPEKYKVNGTNVEA